jgi:hypothetical protein
VVRSRIVSRTSVATRMRMLWSVVKMKMKMKMEMKTRMKQR